MEFRVANWQNDCESLSRIRRIVFMEEQGVSAADEWDGLDPQAIHFLINTQQTVIGCARLLIEPQALHIGRVALLAPYRGQGIGQHLIQFILSWCLQQHPSRPIYLHAQTTRLGFYEQLGFKASGSVFIDAGIPHISMWYQPGQHHE